GGPPRRPVPAGKRPGPAAGPGPGRLVADRWQHVSVVAGPDPPGGDRLGTRCASHPARETRRSGTRPSQTLPSQTRATETRRSRAWASETRCGGTWADLLPSSQASPGDGTQPG